MPTVQVRDFPEALFEKLRRSAEREHRSVPQQVIAITEAYVNGASNTAADRNGLGYHGLSEREALFEGLRNATPGYTIPKGFPSAAELIRQDRDAR